jgi:hypothetical protein
MFSLKKNSFASGPDDILVRRCGRRLSEIQPELPASISIIDLSVSRNIILELLYGVFLV